MLQICVKVLRFFQVQLFNAHPSLAKAIHWEEVHVNIGFTIALLHFCTFAHCTVAFLFNLAQLYFCTNAPWQLFLLLYFLNIACLSDALLHYCTIAPLHYWTIEPLQYSTIELLKNCTSALFLHDKTEYFYPLHL